MSRFVTRALRVAALAAVSAAVLSSAPRHSVLAQAQPRADVIISFRAAVADADEALVRGLGGAVRHRYHLIPAIAASLPQAAIDGLARNPRVARIEPDGIVYADDFASELHAAWGVEHIGAGTLHESGPIGNGVHVAVIDSGIDCSHPDLAGQCDEGFDFVNDDDDPFDDDSHGTHVAGTIAALRNMTGVVGVAPGVRLHALKVLNQNGTGSFSDVIAALQWVVDHDIQVTNNSYGSSQNPGTAVETAFNAALAAGVLSIASAGNSGRCNGKGNTVGYPARYASVVAVAATGMSDTRACFSSTGPDVELSAPGVGILSTIPGGAYAAFNGTSMASPHVAGVAALVVSAGASDTNGVNGVADEVRGILQATAGDLGAAGRDEFYGFGLVDAPAAVGAVTAPADAIHVSLATDKTTYVQGVDTVVGLTATVTDEVGAPVSGINGAMFTTTLDGPPATVSFVESAPGTGVYSGTLDLPGSGNHAVTVQVDDGSLSDADTAPFEVITQPQDGSVGVTDIGYGGSGGRDGTKHLIVVATVRDGDGALVSGALVSVTVLRNGSAYASLSATTGGTGQVSFQLTNAPAGAYTTTVTGVAASGLTWDGATPPNGITR
jgi:subtilisin